MYHETRDEDVLRKFWADEKSLPTWFQDGTDAKGTSWEDFKGFCDQSEHIYLVDNVALIYVEDRNGLGSIHFSLLRGNDPFTLVDDLKVIRDELLDKYDLLFGFVGTHNNGLRKFIEAIGFEIHGLKMYWGQSHNRQLEWHCYSYNKNFVSEHVENVLSCKQLNAV